MKFSFYITFSVCLCLVSCKSKKNTTQVISEPVQTTTTNVTGLNLGNNAPSLSGKNFTDSLINLQSLKGKLVLIDFWASWCAPCRIENPNVVKNYLNYKDKTFTNGNGFTVFSVSLDEKKESWQKAVIKDNLSWACHISDLKGWNSSYALKYNITGIPYNYLINGDGVIIAKNLTGSALTKTLEKYIKN